MVMTAHCDVRISRPVVARRAFRTAIGNVFLPMVLLRRMAGASIRHSQVNRSTQLLFNMSVPVAIRLFAGPQVPDDQGATTDRPAASGSTASPTPLRRLEAIRREMPLPCDEKPAVHRSAVRTPERAPAADSQETQRTTRVVEMVQGAPVQMDAPWPQPPAASAVNVERLTDRVIQAIERRVVARRERMGRA
jgi:hypothetical protein